MVIDTHAHVLPRDFPSPSAAGHWPQMQPIDADTARLLVAGELRFAAAEVFFAAERRVEAMDAAGVSVEVVSPMPPLLNYDCPAPVSVDISRYVNESVARLAAEAPDRIVGFGMVPLQDPDLAAACLAELAALGLRGLEIGSNVRGTWLGDARFLDFFREAERLALPVFVHATRPTFTDGLPAAAMPSFGFTSDVALTAASVVMGGTAQACPDLRLMFSHGAGGFPLALPRANFFWGGTWNEDPPSQERRASAPAPCSPSEYARRFFYDALVFDRRALRYLIDMVGPTQVLLGTDFPAMDREQPADRTLRSMDLPTETLEDVTWNNGWRFLGLPEAPPFDAPRLGELAHEEEPSSLTRASGPSR